MKKYIILFMFCAGTLCASERIENVSAVTDAAAALRNGQMLVTGGGEAVTDIQRTVTSKLINSNEFEKMQNYAKDIEQTYVNIESTTDGIKNATAAALASVPTTDEYKKLLSPETTTTETKNYDVPQDSLASGITYVKNTFFVNSEAVLKANESEALKMQEAKSKRTSLYQNVALDTFAYSQAYISSGKEDFTTRLDAIHAKQKQINTEAAAIAVVTLSLKNIIQETMLQVVLEQKQLKMEAVKNLYSQRIDLIQIDKDTATKEETAP